MKFSFFILRKDTERIEISFYKIKKNFPPDLIMEDRVLHLNLEGRRSVLLHLLYMRESSNGEFIQGNFREVEDGIIIIWIYSLD